MQGLDLFDDDDGGGTVFRDVIMLALAGFVAIVILLLPHINPPATAKEGIDAPGNVIVELRWPDQMDVDVDLWVLAPGGKPVGYSNKGGKIFNLLRDDLGRRSDSTELNYEVSYSRGIPAGEYIANVHLYRNRQATYPVPVTITASVKKTAQHSPREIVKTELMLNRDGEEVTAFRFRLDENGRLEPGSVHNLPRKLRSSSKS